MIEKKIIKTEGSSKTFSALGGIFLYDKLMKSNILEPGLVEILPENKIDPSTSSSYDKFKALCLSFVAGADCLDDMAKLENDIGFREILGYVNAPITYGEYLRSFTNLQIRDFRHSLIENAMKLRMKAFPKEKDFIFDLDSTSCRQYGEKMEGAEFNYKNEWSLDSIQGYDQFGIQYYIDVRPGSTYSSNSAVTIIHEVLKRVPFVLDRYVRADCAFAIVDVYNAIMNKDGKFVIAMKKNVYNPLLERIENWKRSKLKFHDGRKVEIGHTVYHPDRCRKTLRVTAIRALKEDRQRSLFKTDSYEYFVCVSNIEHSEMSNEKLIKFYRKRGQAENFIKELKYGFDARHWPCQSLDANKVYGIIAGYAYNLMRYMAYRIEGKRVPYSKMIRFKTVYLACQVIRRGRYVTLRFNHEIKKEVDNWINTIQKEFSYGFV